MRRYHLHLPGVAYAIVTAFVLLGAINSQNNLLFWALGLAIGGLLASGFVSGVSLMGVAIEREPLAEAQVGRPFAIRYRVRNRGRLMPAYALLIEELPPKGVDRRDWPLTGRPLASLGRVPARRTVRCETSALVERRGPFELGRVRVSTTFPFGVARKSVTFDLSQPAIATPRVHRLRSDVVETILEPTHDGTEALASPGAGEEFYGVREYRVGDRVRDVSWRLSARSDALVVMQRSARSPRKLILHLDLDPDLAAQHDERAELLLSLAASLIAEAGRGAIATSLAAPEVGLSTSAVTTPAGRAGLQRTLGMYGFAEPGAGGRWKPEARFGAVVLTLTRGPTAGGVRTLSGEDLARLSAEPLGAKGDTTPGANAGEGP
ncbi:MAG: DUF58 domain-containing protein [Phycisphaerales bacterium]